MDASSSANVWGWCAWKFAVISLAGIVVVEPFGLMFSTPTALGYVQLPGVIITILVACCSVVCFMVCPRRAIAAKLVTLLLAVIPLLIMLDLLKDYYLHVRYGT
jgi:hypothetical protein